MIMRNKSMHMSAMITERTQRNCCYILHLVAIQSRCASHRYHTDIIQQMPTQLKQSELNAKKNRTNKYCILKSKEMIAI